LKDLANKLSKPKREFCVGGPIPREGHYVLRDRPEIGQIIEKIEKGKYFVIYAARQVGKTSLIQEVVHKLSEYEKYLPLYLTFQGFDHSLSEEVFYRQLSKMLLFDIRIRLKRKGKEESELKVDECNSHLSFMEFLEELHRQIPYQLCILIDEFEDIPQDVLDGFLHTLRGIYLRKQMDEDYNILHSVGVVGVHSISQMTFARTSSPFNIHEAISIANFTLEQVKELLMQYSEETGEFFPEEVISFIADKTGGQPYLVNLVAKILTTEVKPYMENRPITIDDAEKAYMKMLTMRGNTNLDSIRKRIKNDAAKSRLVSIIYDGNVDYNLEDDALEELITLGVISEQDGKCVISNPAYAHTIISAYRPWRNGPIELHFPEGFQPLFDENGFLKPHPVIENFQYFLPQVDPKFYYPKSWRLRLQGTPLEIIPHYFLLSQFNVLSRHNGGHARAEVYTGHRRMDIVVFERGGKKTIVECKIWRGFAYQNEAREQLISYLNHEGLSVGYLVFFDKNRDATYVFSTAVLFEKIIREYIIPLPERLINALQNGF